MVSKILHGVVQGKHIELDEDPGVPEGRSVEVEVRIIEANNAPSSPLSEDLAKVYAILGERYSSGHTDTAARHDEHQP